MVEDFRKPEIISDNGLVSIQNGTYEQVSNEKTLELIKPFGQLLHISNDFYKLLEDGSLEDVIIFINELTTFNSQMSKMVAKIKKANGKLVIPDVKYFYKKFDEINNKIENLTYKEARILQKELAKEFSKEFRECLKICIAHNYNETLFLHTKGVEIEIPEKTKDNMVKITQEVENNSKPPKALECRINFKHI